MQNGMNEYVSRLVALRTLFESANEEITRSEFETFSGRLFEHHPGMLRVAWVPRITRKERAEYEAAAVGDGISGYRIKAFNTPMADSITAPQSDEYFPVFFSTEPKTSGVYGLDYSARPAAARRTGTGAGRRSDHGIALEDFYDAERGQCGRRRCWSACRSTPRAPRGRPSPTGGATWPAL